MTEAYDNTLYFIAEENGHLDGLENELTISLPNIFRTNNFTYELHPNSSHVFEFKNLTIGRHTGVFYNFNETGIIGFGAKYASGKVAVQQEKNH